jgi:hypothetical protein
MRKNIFNDTKQTAINGIDNVFAQFLLAKGLYDSMDITEDNISDLIALVNGQVRISCYCTECKEERVFVMNPITYFAESGDEFCEKSLGKEVDYLQKIKFFSEPVYCEGNGGDWQWKNWQIEETARVLVFKFICTMSEDHHLDYIVLTTNNNRFCKIGQFPSIADLTFPELDIYKKVMSSVDRKEFGRAIGLYASGIGAGSYVYLRRIFERMLMSARRNADDAIDENMFNQARVDEKIIMMKDYLPNMLTSNSTLYGILSKGIHELTEDECLAYFPVVKDCIFMILDEWEELRKKQEKEKSVSVALSKIASEIKKVPKQ